MLRKLSAYTLVLGFLLSSILPIIAASGTASAATLASVSDRAASWSLMRLVVENVCKFDSSISTANADSGNLTKSTNVVSVGYHTAGNADQMSCQDALKKGLSYWDPANNTRAFLVNIGYTLQGDNYVKGSGYSNDVFVNALPASLFSGSRTAATNDILYQIFYTNFVTGCQAQFKELWATASPNDQKSVDTNDNWYRIFQVNSSGSVEEAIYTAALGKAKRINVGYGIGTTSPGQADCYELSAKLQNRALADAFAPLIKSDTSAQSTSAGSTATGGGTGTGSNSCYSGIPIFGWILCPFLDLADSAYTTAKTVVQDLLKIDSSSVSSDSGLYQSWSIMRNLSSAAIVLVALTMVAGQIFNFEFMSAYTVKKVLPRLVIAAILIQLSWFLFTTMIIIVNAIGDGLYSLLTAPFVKTGSTDIMDLAGKLNTSAPVASALAGTGISFAILGSLAVAGVAVFTGGALLSLVIAAIGVLISILVTIFTLIVRKTLIVVLLALAPLALVAWILPGTQRFWDMWWKLFSRLLLMYPLIMLLFAAGTIGANILANQKGAGAMDYVAVIVAYFAPLFLIPSTFKFAGGMFTGIVGGINKLGSRARGSGYFGLRDQAKADKDFAKKKNINRAYKTLGDNEANFARRGIARWRTGTISTGLPGSRSKHDFNERLEAVQREGRNAAFEEGMKEAQNTFGDVGVSSLGYKDRGDAMLSLVKARNGDAVTLANGKTIVANDSTRRLALDTLGKDQNTSTLFEARNFIDGRDANGAALPPNIIANTSLGNPDSVGKLNESWNSVISGGSNFGSIDAKNPYLTRGQSANGFGAEITAGKMDSWDDTAVKGFAQFIQDQKAKAIDPTVPVADQQKAAALVAAKQAELKRALLEVVANKEKHPNISVGMLKGIASHPDISSQLSPTEQQSINNL